MSEWKPIKTAPLDGQCKPFLAYSSHINAMVVCYAVPSRISGGVAAIVDWNASSFRDATHWMPLPEPPKENA